MNYKELSKIIDKALPKINTREEFAAWLKDIPREKGGRYEALVSGNRVVIGITPKGDVGYWTSAYLNGTEVYDEYESDIAVVPSVHHFDIEFKDDKEVDEFVSLFKDIKTGILEIAPSAKVIRTKRGFTYSYDARNEREPYDLLKGYEDSQKIVFVDQVSIGNDVLKNIFHWVDAEVRNRIDFVENTLSELEGIADEFGLLKAERYTPSAHEYGLLKLKFEDSSSCDNFVQKIEQLNLGDWEITYRISEPYIKVWVAKD